MPNRVIKESIKRSPQIDSLTWFEEVVYYRLMVTADDYGCLDGRTILLKNELFPTKDTVTKKAVEDAISKLVSVGLLCKYTANDMPYLFFPTWEKHQRLRNKHRKYPDPFENGLTDVCQSNDGQMTASCQPEIESKKNPKKKEKENSREASDPPPFADSPILQEAFERWIVYKQERREPYKSQGMKSLITEIRHNADKYGAEAVSALINKCMASNWKGIIWERLDKQHEAKPWNGKGMKPPSAKDNSWMKEYD